MKKDLYQLDLVMPGNKHWWAISRKTCLDKPKSRKTPRGRPVFQQRFLMRTCELFLGNFCSSECNSSFDLKSLAIRYCTNNFFLFWLELEMSNINKNQELVICNCIIFNDIKNTRYEALTRCRQKKVNRIALRRENLLIDWI